MKKITIVALIMVILIEGFVFWAFYKAKHLFDLDSETTAKYINEVYEYLSDKYNEEMIIYDYGYYETFTAKVYPKNNEDIKFMVYGWITNDGYVYKDNYFENYLDYSTYINIQPILDMYFEKATFDGQFNSLAPADSSEYYYEKYKDVEFPIGWDNPKCDECIEEIVVNVESDEEITEEMKNEIEEKIRNTNVKFKKISFKKVNLIVAK